MKGGLAMMLLTVAIASSAACGKSGADVAALKTRGVNLLGQGQYDLAIRAFDSAIALRPDDADAYNSRGNAYASRKELDRAIQDYDSATTLNPKNAFAFKNRGATYAAKDDLDLAM